MSAKVVNRNVIHSLFLVWLLLRITRNRFHNDLFPFKIISVKYISKVHPDFDHRRLDEWQRKNYTQKLLKEGIFSMIFDK